MSEKKENTETTEVKPFEGFNMFALGKSKTNTPITETKKEDQKPVIEDITKKDKPEVKVETPITESVVETKEEELENQPIVEPTNVEDEPSLKPLIEEFHKEGLFDIEEEDLEKFDNSIESIKEFQEKTVAKRAEKLVTDWKSGFPEDAQKFIEYVENGGNPKEFHAIYYETGSFADFAIDNEENQKHVIREGLKLDGYPEEEIEDQIQLFEDSGKLEQKAKLQHNKLIKFEAAQKEQLLLSQKALREKQIEDNKKQIESLKKDLFDKKDINGFPTTTKLKEELWDYMTKPDKTGKTKLQQSYESNKDAQFMYAYLAMLNWDIDKLKKGVRTEVTQDLKKKLGNYTDSRTKMKGTTEYNRQEMEDKQGDFSGFSRLLKPNK